MLQAWGPVIAGLTLVPGSGGVFEVTLDDEVVFSKKALGRHAKPGEVVDLLRERMGPEIAA